MTVLYEQTFLWTPKSKDRPRAQPGGKGRSYTPAATKRAEQNILDQYAGPLFDQPLRVEFDFTNDTVLMRVYEAVDYVNRKLRGDTDNYLKLTTDALNKYAWSDDKIIVDLRGRKL